MGRSRRRNRHGMPEETQNTGTVENVISITPVETLAPTYVPVTPSPWSAESDTPALALEGVEPWGEIPGPAIAIEDDPGPSLDVLPDSLDPSQLILAPGAETTTMTEAVEVVDDRPILLLESEPPVEVQAELPLTIPSVPVVRADDDTIAATEAPEVIAEPEPVVDPVEVRFQEGRAAADEGRSADARAIYRDVIAQRPTHLSARNNLALLLERGGDSQGALSEYDRALELDAEHATLLTNRGALLGAMGRYAAAERDLKKVLRADANHLEALYNLGVVMTRKGLWGEAVAQLRRVVEIDPMRGVAYFYLGEALNKVDDLYGAMAAYQRAAELLPEHARALYGLGIVYDRLGRPDDAARMYRRSREAGKR